VSDDPEALENLKKLKDALDIKSPEQLQNEFLDNLKDTVDDNLDKSIK